MTTIKLDPKLGADPAEALHPHATALFARPGARIVGVVELTHVERVEPAPDEDKEASVKVRVTGLEIGADDQAEPLRQAMRALYLTRTAHGTLTEDDDVELSETTLAQTAGLLATTDAARLRVTGRALIERARSAMRTPNATAAELRHELDALARLMEGALRPPVIAEPE